MNDYIVRFLGILASAAILFIVLVAIFNIGVYFEDKYDQAPDIFVSAGYINRTTIGISFTDVYIDNTHFYKITPKIDLVNINIDEINIATINGSDLTTNTYYYRVDSSRHDAYVTIKYKNGKIINKSFSNCRLEGVCRV